MSFRQSSPDESRGNTEKSDQNEISHYVLNDNIGHTASNKQLND